MRAVLLAALALAGILLCARVFVADMHYRSARDLPLDDPERVTRLERANRIDSGDAVYAFRLGESALETGNLEGALRWFAEAARRNPLMARAQYWWAVALERARRGDEALEHLEIARRLAPFNVDLNRRIASQYAERWGRTRSPEDLRRAFETAHAIRRVDPDAVSDALVVEILRHPLLRYEELIAAVDSMAPGDPEVRLTLARTLAGSREPRLRWAMRAFDDADRLADAGGALSAEGRLIAFEKLRREYPEAALERLREALDLLGEERFAHERELAQLLLERSHDDEARAALRRHFRKTAETDLPGAIDQVRRVFAGVTGRAPAELAQAELEFWDWARMGYSSLDAAEIDYHASRAALAAGRRETALGAIQRYLVRYSTEPRALHHAALCYESLGRKEAARRHLRLALRHSSDPEYLKLAERLGMETDR
jgi:tetratricopeptide (TPR) repeat protein